MGGEDENLALVADLEKRVVALSGVATVLIDICEALERHGRDKRLSLNNTRELHTAPDSYLFHSLTYLHSPRQRPVSAASIHSSVVP